ncbi:hypothetical protein LTR56_002301 [Elasticomyces elasticus]|nr:hypothetical protein LTR56_002301 [Elasticomyces elasticus]KAK3665866.1 hypothetical protein LTR22_003184 [Elasticomyces elasticus]KAK4929338.1 hypothetical protein LTR49_003941 [Elasticomyces elasticus]KAK5764627.1 hypothetical protein LTS12_005127 [Elasticomyces elasticus]
MSVNRFDDATLAKLSPKHQDLIRKRRNYDETVKRKAAAGAPLSYSAGTVTVQWLTTITGDPQAIASLEVKRRTARKLSRRYRAKKPKAAQDQGMSAHSELEATSTLGDGHISADSEYVPVKDEKGNELRQLVRRNYQDTDEEGHNANDQEVIGEEPVLTQRQPAQGQGQVTSGPTGRQLRSVPQNGRISQVVKGKPGNDADAPIDLCASDDEGPLAMKVETSHEQTAALTAHAPSRAGRAARVDGSDVQAAVVQSESDQVPSMSPAEIRLLIQAERVAQEKCDHREKELELERQLLRAEAEQRRSRHHNGHM